MSVFSLEDGLCVRYFGSRGKGESQLHYPKGIHFDEKCKLLFIVDSGNHRVKVVKPDGSLVRMFSERLAYPWDTTVDTSQDEVFIADWINHEVQVWDLLTGRFIRKIGYTGSEDDQSMNHPSGVLWDARTGRLFVSAWDGRQVSVFE